MAFSLFSCMLLSVSVKRVTTHSFRMMCESGSCSLCLLNPLPPAFRDTTRAFVMFTLFVLCARKPGYSCPDFGQTNRLPPCITVEFQWALWLSQRPSLSLHKYSSLNLESICDETSACHGDSSWLCILQNVFSEFTVSTHLCISCE